ncbi:sugar transferase [Patescibacteria group bacterium]|nr:sugar transferase [Patescibacteria group bacterium]
MKKAELVFTAILPPLDFIMLFLAGIAAYFLRTNPLVSQYRPVLFHLNLPFSRYLALIITISVFMLFVFALVGLYRIRLQRILLDDFFKIVIGVSAGIIGLVFYSFVRLELFDSRFLIVIGWAIAITFVSFGRFVVHRWQRHLMRKHNFGLRRALVIGTDGVSQKIVNYIKSQPILGYQLATNLDKLDLDAIRKKVKNLGVEEIILADSDWPKEKILELINFCDDYHLTFKFVPNLFQTLTVNTSVETLGDVPIIELRRTALNGWGRIIKRVVDFIGALIGLIVLSPFFALVAVFIKWDSRGQVLVQLKRVSQGKEFQLYKFRSMIDGAEKLKPGLQEKNERKDGPLFKIKNDPRVTKVGRVLRKYRLDEFPQLINVLKGEMSLIGPRPHQPDEIAWYQKHHKKVLAIKSGMTGFAQISGSSDLPFEEEIKLDTYYVENWSLIMDLKIFLRTWLVLLKDRSAC